MAEDQPRGEVQPLAGAVRLVLDLDGDRDGAPVVRGDPERLRQLLLNLAANASASRRPGARSSGASTAPRPSLARAPQPRQVEARKRSGPAPAKGGAAKAPGGRGRGLSAAPRPAAARTAASRAAGRTGLARTPAASARRAGGRASARPETTSTGTAAVAGSALRSPSSAPPER